MEEEGGEKGAEHRGLQKGKGEERMVLVVVAIPVVAVYPPRPTI